MGQMPTTVYRIEGGPWRETRADAKLDATGACRALHRTRKTRCNLQAHIRDGVTIGNHRWEGKRQTLYWKDGS